MVSGGILISSSLFLFNFLVDSDPNGVKIQIKLGNGKVITRKYNKHDLVKSLFAVAVEADPENATRSFDLVSRFTPFSLLSCCEKSIDECKLAGSSVLHRWLP
jgi:hypothetical protein